jgi:hypothetical protein
MDIEPPNYRFQYSPLQSLPVETNQGQRPRRGRSGFDNSIGIGELKGQLPQPSSKNYQYRTTSFIGQVGDATTATSDASSVPLPNMLLMSVMKIKPPK